MSPGSSGIVMTFRWVVEESRRCCTSGDGICVEPRPNKGSEHADETQFWGSGAWKRIHDAVEDAVCIPGIEVISGVVALLLARVHELGDSAGDAPNVNWNMACR